ncbi:MAG: hypothetical protein C7B45_11640 [Sulfobacillus acidophilus]|uniref:Uncharacterized protein n=1 Tax=Sulfobacillus acidophilus TaxID=53633 RepID=A0A2T2WGB8_9FIRM|nr:MAG: hypothetical protein C7B45_11640 [Sulfobacillus acidophilus]
MAVIRTVFVPLSHEPEVLFGLTLADLVWPAASILATLVIWHDAQIDVSVRLAFSALVMAAGMTLAKVRIEEVSLPQWATRIALFCLKPRLYLP